MALIQIEIDEETDSLFKALAKQEGRTKRAQVKHSAITHARSLLPDFRAPQTNNESSMEEAGK